MSRATTAVIVVAILPPYIHIFRSRLRKAVFSGACGPSAPLHQRQKLSGEGLGEAPRGRPASPKYHLFWPSGRLCRPLGQKTDFLEGLQPSKPPDHISRVIERY